MVCQNCIQDEKDCILEKTPEVISNLFEFPHYLILDTNVVLDQIDVLEENTICNVVVLSTVIDEVKNKSSSVFNRFRDVYKSSWRKFFVFVNEHHKDTYVVRKPGESTNDRNDRAIRVATKWYDTHLAEQQKDIPEEKRVRVVLISDDAGNRAKAKEEGILVCTVEEYLKSLLRNLDLLDKICKKDYEFESNKKALFPPHLSVVEIHQGIRGKRFIQGQFMASRENYLEGTVMAEGYEKGVSL